MENQVNISNQSTRQIGQNPVSRSIHTQEKPKLNYWIISTVCFALLFISTLAWHIIYVSKLEKQKIMNPTPLQQSQNRTSLVPTPLVSPIATNSPIPGNSHFSNKELKISFTYPNELGPAQDKPASKGKGGSAIEGEEWWKIDFDERAFVPGYYEISASTPNYAPSSWEGSPHWLNIKINTTDSIESVKQKLVSANFLVLKVQKVYSSKNVVAYIVWTLDCYVGCALARVYLVPLSNVQYNNLLIYTILKNLNTGEESETIDHAKTLATPEIVKIENKQADGIVIKYLTGQDLIFNTLIIGN